MSGDVYEFSAILLLEDAIESDPQSKASFWFSLFVISLYKQHKYIIYTLTVS